MYSLQEKVEIFKYFNAGNSARQVSSLFSVKYANRPIPDGITVDRIVQKF